MSGTILYAIAERVFKQPLLIHEDKLPLILAVIEGRLPIDAAELNGMFSGGDEGVTAEARAVIEGPAQGASRFYGSREDVDPATGKAVFLPYAKHGSAAIIRVMGSLVNRGAWLGAASGLTSYEGLQFQLRAAAADAKVDTVLLDVASPGGEANGAFETAKLVRQVSATKPVIAVVNGMAASAAYAIASGASKIVLGESSMAGSIGVVMLHADFSRDLDRRGITPTLIFAGKHKVDGNPYQPLSREVTAKLQASVDKTYADFVALVAAHRGRTEAQVRATEADIFAGGEAIAIGLADEIGSFDAVITDLSNRGAGRNPNANRRSSMAVENQPAVTAGTFTQTQVDAMVSDAVTKANAASKASLDAAVADASKKATADERARINAIVSSDEAKERAMAAQQVALTTSMTVDESKTFLAKLPKETAAEATGGRDASLGLLTGGKGNDPKPEASADLWKQSAERINKRFG